MNAYTSRPIAVRPFALPNLLTYGRIAAIPAVVACLYWQEIPQHGEWLRWLALTIFIAAGVTDFLDGYLARKWGELTSFGRWYAALTIRVMKSAKGMPAPFSDPRYPEFGVMSGLGFTSRT